MKVCEKCGKAHRTASVFRPELCSVCAFWASVTVKGPDDCWLWAERLDKDGYGDARFVRFGEKAERKAHRIAWSLANGPIPDGMGVLHCCDDRYPVDDKTNRKCVNPAHLRIGTPADNSCDCAKHGRSSRGEAHHSSKLTEEQVAHVATSKESLSVAAKRLGVSRSMISHIRLGLKWSHVTGLKRARVTRPSTRRTTMNLQLGCIVSR